MRIPAAVLAATMFVTSARAEQSFDEVFACMRASVPATLQVRQFELISTDRQNAERVLKGRLFAERKHGNLRVMMKLDAPASVKGAAYLVREFAGNQEDEMYVFLPAVGRVRHITGSFANGALLGTDFSYAEAKLIQNGYTGADGRLEAETELDGRPVHRISLRPGPNEPSPYTRIRVWVDSESCVALKAEFYEGDTLRKELVTSATGLARSDGRWYPSNIEMRDLKTGTRSRLSTGRFKAGEKFGERLFDPNSFHIGG